MGSQNTSSKPVNQNKKNDKPPQNNKEDDNKLPKIKSTANLLPKDEPNQSHQSDSSYDYIIDNISFTNIQKSLLKITGKSNSSYQNEKSIILGIVGNISSGKTHILNKILPSIKS